MMGVAPALADVLGDSSADFSGVQGAKSWYYGIFPAGDVNAFLQLPVFDTQRNGWDQTVNPPPWTFVGAYSAMHPNGANSGAVQWAVREWRSAFNGPAVIDGKIFKSDTNPASPGVYGIIFLNHAQIWNQFIAGADGVGVSYSIPVTLRADDVIDFALAPNGVDYNDSTVFSATISSLYSPVSVNFGIPQAVLSASGFLHGATSTSPRARDITPLQPQFWRIPAYLSAYKTIRSFAPGIPIHLILSDVYGYPDSNFNGNGPPWQDWTAWEAFVRNTAAPFKTGTSNVIFDVWNEPDDGWAIPWDSPAYQVFWNGSVRQFYDTYFHAWNALTTELGAGVLVAGPTFSTYDHAGVQEFLEYCLASGCEVNSLTWHALNDSSDPAALPGNVQDALTSFVQNARYSSLQMSRIDINEMIGGLFWHQPAGTLQYFSAFERSGATAAARTCGFDSSSQCFNGTLNGLLTSPGLQPTGAWWLEKYYADGAGARVLASATSATIVALASGGAQGGQPPQILVGYADYQASAAGLSPTVTVDLTLAAAGASTPSTSAGVVGVRVEHIPDTDTVALAQPEFVEDVTLPLTGGSGTILLPQLPLGDVFRVTLLGAQSISFPSIADVLPGSQGVTLNATASSALSVTFTSNTNAICKVTANQVTMVAAGTCSITASQAGNALFTAATPVTQTFSFLASQTITFAPPGNVAAGGAPFSIFATASSGLTVAFSSTTQTVCSVSGNTVTIVAAGGCSITASQAGNATYVPARPVKQNFTVLFTDVAPADYYFPAITAMAQYGITAGCGSNKYCPQQDVTRDEMAVFVVRAIYGGDSFTYSPTPYFTDVPPTTFGFKWIQRLFELGITAGCTTGMYCPTEVVTRDEMAIFIIRARLGLHLAGSPVTFTYSQTPYFADATSGEFAFPWIQRLRAENITAGCSATDYCPGEPVTRGDMALFIMRGAFNQFLPAGTPVIAQISPSTLPPGTSGTYTITGTNTNFVQGTTQLSPIPGVSAGTIMVTSPNTMTVQLTAAADAISQPYSILLITGTEQDVLPNGLVLQ